MLAMLSSNWVRDASSAEKRFAKYSMGSPQESRQEALGLRNGDTYARLE